MKLCITDLAKRFSRPSTIVRNAENKIQIASKLPNNTLDAGLSLRSSHRVKDAVIPVNDEVKMEDPNGINIKYLDTSSIAKLYLEEDGSSRFRAYFGSNTNFCTALMTFYETMNVLKSRLFNGSNRDKYYDAVEDLAIQGWGGKIELELIDLSKREVFKEVSKLASENGLDVADAVQIYAILKGKYGHWCQDSASVLITADGRQERTAGKYGIRVWNCRKTERPEWLDN